MSSALLFLSVTFAPYHVQATDSVAGGAGNGSPMITEFYPRALCADEYFSLGNPTSRPIDLRNWSITDGEGTIRFLASWMLPALGETTLSFNSSSFERAYGRRPDIGLDEARSAVYVSRSGTFRLADSGDSLVLVDPSGIPRDTVVYGSGPVQSGWVGNAIPSLRQGEVAKRMGAQGSWSDTDRASDWMPFREYKYGYTEFSPASFAIGPGRLEAFVSPDCSLEVVLDALRNAGHSILLSSYELSSSQVCIELVNARARGVAVKVLVDGQPAGGIDEREIQCLSVLSSSGLDVREVDGNLTTRTVQHVGPLHAKYAVVDESISIILSENFVEGGLPRDKIEGNRGWGVKVGSPELAAYLTRVFEEDARLSRPDVVAWRDDPRYVEDARLPRPPVANHTMGALRPLVTKAASTVGLYVSPDASDRSPFLVGHLENAKTARIQQFQVGLTWESRWDPVPRLSPLLGSVLAALRNDAEVKMLFDSSWFNAEGNKPALDYMISTSRNLSANGEFKLMDPRSPITVTHNKGAVLDGELSLVSSNNWGFSSFAKNREVAAMITSSEVAGYLGTAFDMDWSPDSLAPVAIAGPDVEARVGECLELNGSLSSDDRVIAHMSWDLDSDGAFESKGANAAFACIEPGTYEVVLRVEDSWGNSATDVVVISVRDDSSSIGLDIGADGILPVALALSGICGSLGGAIAARRRERFRGRLITRKKLDGPG